MISTEQENELWFWKFLSSMKKWRIFVLCYFEIFSLFFCWFSNNNNNKNVVIKTEIASMFLQILQAEPLRPFFMTTRQLDNRTKKKKFSFSSIFHHISLFAFTSDRTLGFTSNSYSIQCLGRESLGQLSKWIQYTESLVVGLEVIGQKKHLPCVIQKCVRTDDCKA